MPKGAATSRSRFRPTGLDLLEGRLLLSHLGSLSAIHEAAVPTAHVVTAPASNRSEVETGRAGSTAQDSSESRSVDEQETSAASTTGSKAGYSLPPVSLVRSGDGRDAAEASSLRLLDPTRFLRASRDEPIAWGLAGSSDSGKNSIGRHRSAEIAEIPDPAAQAIDGSALAGIAGPTTGSDRLGLLPEPDGSDLLAEFLPADRASIDRAIDRLLDGLEGLGLNRVGELAESTTMVPSPLIWGVVLTALEVARRRLRKSSRRRRGDGPDSGVDEFLA